jgi:hypothetical protein
MSLKDDLIAAKKLIDTPEKWAEDTLPKAVIQAIDLNPARWTAARVALLAAIPGHPSLVAFNYDPATTHADVMALFDRAIEAAGA